MGGYECLITGGRDRLKYGGKFCNKLEVRTDDLHVHSKNMSLGLFFTSRVNPHIQVKNAKDPKSKDRKSPIPVFLKVQLMLHREI